MEASAFRDDVIECLNNIPCLKKRYKSNDLMLNLSEDEVFNLWNVLGEEFGIDLSLVSHEQRKLLFKECRKNRFFSADQFISLVWLVFYSEIN